MHNQYSPAKNFTIYKDLTPYNTLKRPFSAFKPKQVQMVCGKCGEFSLEANSYYQGNIPSYVTLQENIPFKNVEWQF